MRVYSLTLRNRFIAGLVVLGLIGLGAAVLFIGAALFAGLAVAGAVLGTGAAIYNRLRGRGPLDEPRIREAALDPTLEVFAEHRKLPPSAE